MTQIDRINTQDRWIDYLDKIISKIKGMNFEVFYSVWGLHDGIDI